MASLSRSLLKHLCVKSIIKYFQHKIMLQPVAYLTKKQKNIANWLQYDSFSLY